MELLQIKRIRRDAFKAILLIRKLKVYIFIHISVALFVNLTLQVTSAHVVINYFIS